MKTAEITVTRSAVVPLGPVCANWAYRTNMPPEQNYHCAQLADTSQRVTAEDARRDGLGHSAGTIMSFHCRLFDEPLRHGLGGPYKCAACLRAIDPARKP